MKRIGLLLGSVFTLLASSCSFDYYGIDEPYNDGLIAYQYVDEFNNNSGNWAFTDIRNAAKGRISNGTFKFEYNDNRAQAYYVSKDIRFNPYYDFTVESRIGSDNNFGMLIGYDAATGRYGYSFTVSYDGKYAFYDEGGNGYGGEISEIVAPRYSSVVNDYGDWNTVRVEQRNYKWIGYVNNTKVFTIPAQKLNVGSVGFVCIPYTKGEADYIEANWLE
jgi:hypothetical protein